MQDGLEEVARQLGALGPYFAVQVHRRDDVPAPPWVGFDALFAPGTASLPARVGATGAALAAMASVRPDRVPERVAGSIAELGIAARLVAPVLGAIALTGSAPGLDSGSIWWQPVLGGPVPLSLAGPEPGNAEPADAEPGDPGPAGSGPAGSMLPPDEAVDALLSGPIARLVTAAESLSVSRTVLWGNVASGVAGAFGQIALYQPDREDDALAAVEAFFRHPLLAGTYEGTCGFDFRRRSCCLIYQLGPAGPARYCGDCILRSR